MTQLEPELEIEEIIEDHFLKLTLIYQGKQIGRAIGRVNAKVFYNIDIQINERLQELGIGTKLVEYQIKRAREIGLKLYETDLRYDEDLGINFYKKLGFKIKTDQDGVKASLKL